MVVILRSDLMLPPQGALAKAGVCPIPLTLMTLISQHLS